jgi:hypothetical protein
MLDSKSPMSAVVRPKSTKSVTTPTRRSFLARVAEEAKTDPPPSEDPPDIDPPDKEEPISPLNIGRISPIKAEQEEEVIPPPKTPVVPKQVESVETITPQHLSPTRARAVDVEDEDEIQERVADLMNDPGKIDYSLEQEEVRLACYESFKSKFQALALNYPDRGILFPEGKSLNKIHDSYHGIIKSIYVNMNLGQIQLGYIIVLMAIEFVCVKAFNIPLAGFTKMELKRMYRYNQLMVELGENLYSTGGTEWPIEWRILGTLVMNIVIFISLKFLAQYVGGESMTEVIRNAVDKVLDNPVTKDNIESGTATKNTTADGLGSMMEGMMGGGDTGGIADIIASLGTGFTEKMEKKSSAAPKKAKRRFIFDD